MGFRVEGVGGVEGDDGAEYDVGGCGAREAGGDGGHEEGVVGVDPGLREESVAGDVLPGCWRWRDGRWGWDRCGGGGGG